MADVLTYEPETEVTSVDNLSEEEQASLQVGESMQEAQDNLLAGKYKNAEELEKAHIELQKKLGEKSGEKETTDTPPETEPKVVADVKLELAMLASSITPLTPSVASILPPVRTLFANPLVLAPI